MQRNSHPLDWFPKGLSDTLDASQTFSGAMNSLQNLIPDPSTPQLWQCRPAAIQKTNFGSFTTPGFISALKVIGNVAYGMIASGRNAGKDEPFAYDLNAGSFITISSITNANTPTSPASIGAWTPPSMDLVGTLLVVTHPGYNGSGGAYFGWLDLTNPAAPVWNAGNLTGAITFTTAPSAVHNFNGRAYYIVNPSSGTPSVVLSDSLAATTVTNASQALTFGDNVALTALGGLALFNQLGGIIQSLMVFKGSSNIYQITGDPATSNLSVNTLNITTGTIAPLTVTQTPKGLAFIAPDGLRLIDFDAKITDPIGIDGKGIAVPFIFSNVPSRMNADCFGSVMRMTVQNNNASGSPWQEYWYDMAREIWHGPHTSAADMIAPWNNTFIITLRGVNAALWQSDIVQSTTSTYVENGNQLTFNFQTALLPDTQQMTNSCMTETTLEIALAVGGLSFLASFTDANNLLLDNVALPPPSNPTIWGSFTWGQVAWEGGLISFAPRQIPWHGPITFSRGYFGLSGRSNFGVKIGALHLRYQILKSYINPAIAAYVNTSNRGFSSGWSLGFK